MYKPEVLRVTDSEGEIEGTPTSCNQGQPTQYQVLVSGNTGIKWRRKQQNVSIVFCSLECVNYGTHCIYHYYLNII